MVAGRLPCAGPDYAAFGRVTLRWRRVTRPSAQPNYKFSPCVLPSGCALGRESPVKVEYTLTAEDYAAAAHAHVQNLYAKPRWAQYRGRAALVLVFLSQGAMLVALGVSWPVVAGVLLLGVLFF